MRIKRFEWDGSDPGGLAARIRALQPSLGDVAEDVERIIAKVAERGDDAVLEFDELFSGTARTSPRVDAGRVREAAASAPPELERALRFAAEQIGAVASAEVAAERPTETVGKAGQRVSLRSIPVAAAGAYVPGGTASYPSSVLMCCIPARVAGVDRVVVASPPGPDGDPAEAVLAACAIAGVDEVYAMGGVQAVAALALGTRSVDPVDVVVGPGNRYVQEAKRQLFGRVGVEGIAGPSELMVILGDGLVPRWAALDLCAQAEHGPDGLLVAAATDAQTLTALEEQIDELTRSESTISAEAPLALVAAPNLESTIQLSDALAPEHLQLAFERAEVAAEQVRNAGCVFVGPASATAFGDYAAGSNHVLPTGGAGRFAGPLGPQAFRRRMATVTVPPDAAPALAPTVDTLAGAEGFPLHGASATARAEAADSGLGGTR